MNKKDTNSNIALLTVQQSAEFLGVNPGTIRRWARDKQLRGLKVGSRGDWRFTREELSKMLGMEKDKKSDKKDFFLQPLTQADEERFRLAAIVESSDDAIISKTLEGKIVSWNKAAEKIFGYKAKEAIGKHITLLIPKWLHSEEVDIINQLKIGKRIEHYETTRVKKDGTKIIVSLAISPIKDDKGNIIGASKIARDITEKRKQEDLLREREEHLELITDNIPVLVSYVDSDERYRFVNKAYERWFGHTISDIEGKHLSKVLGKKAYEAIRPYVKMALSGKNAVYESLVPYKNGGHRYIHASYIPHFARQGEAVGFFALIHDITQRKYAEDSLRVSESNLAAAQHIAKMGSWDFDLYEKEDINKNELRWSDESYRVFGFEPGEIKVTNDLFFSLVHPDDKKRIAKAVADAIKTKTKYSIVHRIILRDGTEKLIHEMGKALYDSHGKPMRMVGTAQDITEQKTAERALQLSELRFKTLTGLAPVGIFETDMNGDCLYVNKRWCEFAGLTLEEARGQGWVKALHPEDKDRVFREWYVAAKQNKEFVSEYRFLSSKGKVTWLNGRGVPLMTAGKVTGFIGTIVDVTDQMQAKEKLEYYASLSSSISDAVISTDTKFKIKSWNWGAEKLYGWKEKDVLGSHVSEILSTKYLPGVDMQTSMHVLTQNGIWQGEVEQVKKDGTAINILASVSSVKDDKGVTVGYVSVNRDITERKKLEQRKDDFVALASHELKTPVTSLKMYTQVLQSRFEKAGDIKNSQFLSKMDNQISKLTGLVNSLLDVSRVQQGKLEYRKEQFALEELIKETVENLQNITSTHQIEIEKLIHQKISADRDRIGQVLINLITNAVKYSPEGSTISVSTTKDESYVKICIKDSGQGIAKDQIDKIFDRFYQVHDREIKTHPGLGLGLYISKEIVERHGGTISVTSKLDVGSTFCLQLPL